MDKIKNALKLFRGWRVQHQYELRLEKQDHAYREKSFPEAIQMTAALEDPAQRIHDLNALRSRITVYLGEGVREIPRENKLESKQKRNPIAKMVRKANRIATDFRMPFSKKYGPADPEHRKKMHDLQALIDRIVDETIENNVEAIARAPNLHWIMSDRVALKFALAAAKHIEKMETAENKAAVPAVKPKPALQEMPG